METSPSRRQLNILPDDELTGLPVDDLSYEEPDFPPEICNFRRLFYKSLPETNAYSLHLCRGWADSFTPVSAAVDDVLFVCLTSIDGSVSVLRSLDADFANCSLVYQQSLLYPNDDKRSPIDQNDHVEMVCCDLFPSARKEQIVDIVQTGVYLCCAYVTFDEFASTVKQSWLHINHAAYDPLTKTLSPFKTVDIKHLTHAVTLVAFQPTGFVDAAANSGDDGAGCPCGLTEAADCTTVKLLLFTADRQCATYAATVGPMVASRWPQLDCDCTLLQRLVGSQSPPAVGHNLQAQWSQTGDWAAVCNEQGRVSLVRQRRHINRTLMQTFQLRFDCPIGSVLFLPVPPPAVDENDGPDITIGDDKTDDPGEQLFLVAPCLLTPPSVYRLPRQPPLPDVSVEPDEPDQQQQPDSVVECPMDGAAEDDDASPLDPIAAARASRLSVQLIAELEPYDAGSADVCTCAHAVHKADGQWVVVTGTFDKKLHVCTLDWSSPSPSASASLTQHGTHRLNSPVMAVHILRVHAFSAQLIVLCTNSVHVVKILL